MGKVLIIGILIALLAFFIMRKLRLFNNTTNSKKVGISKEIIEINTPLPILNQILKKTLITVGTGVVLLIVMVVLMAKFKIALLMLPISLYLIGQFFILNNHIRTIKNQRIFFNTQTNQVTISDLSGHDYEFNLLINTHSIKEYKSVQRNNGVLLGYYEIITEYNKIYIPYLAAENPQTKPFFDKLQLFDRVVESKLFPII